METRSLPSKLQRVSDVASPVYALKTHMRFYLVSLRKRRMVDCGRKDFVRRVQVDLCMIVLFVVTY